MGEAAGADEGEGSDGEGPDAGGEGAARPTLWQGLRARWAMLAAVGAGALVWGGLALLAPDAVASTTRALLAWDAALGVFLAGVAWELRGAGAEAIEQRAKGLDAGALTVLVLTAAAAAACLTAILFEVAAAKAEPGGAGGWRLALAFLTIALSWSATHVAFALHYAHEYFGFGADRRRGGLVFPQGPEDGDDDHQPGGYGDFLYVAFVIGVANQTADVGASSPAMRQVMLWHGLIAFVFNTAIVALCINVAAGLLG